ncbi:MAG: nicotinate (nicotinamide) nucleotide adenylyltransferase [Candidatus Rokubacteria bacterium]|nr:nicotinate (nicotinamide) nucleotide adenylyltransferase [Candidatus Rokubacteria bacterium]
MPRLGVLGGTFNPIHFGHLLVADEVCEVLELDRVLLVPASMPPHKPPAELAPAADRFAMTALAAQEHARFEVSDVELRRRGPSYTVDTLEALGTRGDLFLIIGSETFLDLLTWRDPRGVAARARLVVVPRSGSGFDPDAPASQKVLRELGLDGFVRPGVTGDSPGAPLLVAAASLPISGSELRRRAREGRSLAFRMPAPVAAYIREHGLYRQEA